MENELASAKKAEIDPVMAQPVQEKSPAVQTLERDVAAIKDVRTGVRPIIAARVQQADYARGVHRAITPMEDTIDQILDARYWIGLQHTFKALDKIEVLPDDRRFYAELLVLAVGQNHVPVALTVFRDLPTVEMGSDIPANYKVVYAGPYELFRVLDGDRVLMTKMTDADSAKRWLKDHLASKVR